MFLCGMFYSPVQTQGAGTDKVLVSLSTASEAVITEYCIPSDLTGTLHHSTRDFGGNNAFKKIGTSYILKVEYLKQVM